MTICLYVLHTYYEASETDNEAKNELRIVLQQTFLNIVLKNK